MTVPCSLVGSTYTDDLYSPLAWELLSSSSYTDFLLPARLGIILPARLGFLLPAARLPALGVPGRPESLFSVGMAVSVKWYMLPIACCSPLLPSDRSVFVFFSVTPPVESSCVGG